MAFTSPSSPPPPQPRPPDEEEEQQQQPEPKKLKMSTTTSDEEVALNPNPNPNATDRKPRFKKRKAAIFLAYCGVGYQGMQKNPGAKTIEGDLEEALYHANAVSEADRGIPKRYDWARSARTDKGVSAVGQVVSGRFYVDPPGLVDRLNSILPNQIRVFGYKRVTNSFNAKKFCDRRRYVYLIPVFALDPNCHRDRESVLASQGSGNELVKCLECSERGRKVVGVMGRSGRVARAAEIDGECEIESGFGVESNVVNESVLNSERKSEVSELGVVEEKSSNESALVEESSNFVANGNGKDKESLDLGVNGNGEEKESSNSGVNVEYGEEKESSNLGVSCNGDEKESLDLGVNGNGEEKESSNSGVNVEDGEEKESSNLGVSCNGDEKESLDLGVNGNGEEKGVSENGAGFHYGEEERERFNRILKHYVGTHNFHNYTTRTKAEDPSARRYIVSFDANIVVNVEGMDFVKCEVVGQSFMLHQIRKMIGLAVAVMRNCAPESLIDTALRQDVNITVPTAPEVGLYLDECFFTSYNQKWKESHEELSMKAYAEEAEEFKMKQIYSHISVTEQKEGVVALWLHSLNHRNYPDLCFKETNQTDDTMSEFQVN
ncbi:hypothetical protein Scep_000209 [Stephania cephalantha]|uniref:Pseudouridine synthase I TruA alpha/beta domain-containing protein n=1 Tax=Stephania cephalantha TaxID=152367 RepID=A0AAP0L758_9MAGN